MLSQKIQLTLLLISYVIYGCQKLENVKWYYQSDQWKKILSQIQVMVDLIYRCNEVRGLWPSS